jgi:hypothetical protein
VPARKERANDAVVDGELAHSLANLDYIAGAIAHRNAPVGRRKKAVTKQLSELACRRTFIRPAPTGEGSAVPTSSRSSPANFLSLTARILFSMIHGGCRRQLFRFQSCVSSSFSSPGILEIDASRARHIAGLGIAFPKGGLSGI